MSSTARRPPSDPIGDPTTAQGDSYRSVVEETAAELARSWDHRDGTLDNLLDQICSRLAEEANHELRQVLTQLKTQLELSLRRSRANDAASPETEQELERMLAAVTRASTIVNLYLDRREVAKHLIQIERESLELGALLQDVVKDPALVHAALEIEIQDAWIRGDRGKLRSVLGYLVGRLSGAADPGEHLLVQAQANGEEARGFVGLTPTDLDASQLLEELEKPLEIDEASIDLPFVRAVIERHGGSLYVDQPRPDALGFGFTLPTHEEGDPHDT